MTTITWKINQLERQATDGLVTVVHYSVDAVDGEQTASVYGTIGCERGETFKPFEELTEADVISWVQHALDKPVVEEALQSQIDLKKNPPVLTGKPWASQ